MAMTHDLGPFFVHTVDLKPDSPRHHRAVTYEIEEPFRTSRSHVFRLFGSHGLVFGRWRDSGWSEEDALMAALGREMAEAEPDEIEQWTSAADLDGTR